jgi:DNA-binding MarR family transcriptional regulator
MAFPHDASELLFSMLRLNKTLTDGLDIVFSNIDLLGTQWRVLRLIGASADGLPVPHIARKLGMTRQGVQRLVDRMQGLGFIAFGDNEHHSKSPRAVLTRKGREAFREGRTIEADLGRRMMNVLSDEEVRSTGRVLDKLVAHFRVDHSLVPASADEPSRDN